MRSRVLYETQSTTVGFEYDNDPRKQFLIGKKLIESNDFNGKKYILNAINGGCIDAVIYYSTILIEGTLFPEDLETAKTYLQSQFKSNNATIFFLYGKIMEKEKNLIKQKEFFEKASKLGSGEAMYELGKISPNKEEARKYFNLQIAF